MDAERGLEFSCGCMALLIDGLHPTQEICLISGYEELLSTIRKFDEGGRERGGGGGGEREGDREAKKEEGREGGKESILKNRSCSDYDAGLYNHTVLTHTSLIFTVYIRTYVHIHEYGHLRIVYGATFSRGTTVGVGDLEDRAAYH